MPTVPQDQCVAGIPNCQALDTTPTLCATCVSGYGYTSDQMTCSVCSDPAITNDPECTACTSTVTPAYAVTCTACTTGWGIQGGVCV